MKTREIPATGRGAKHKWIVQRVTCQLIIAVLLTVAGIVLLFLGFFYSPEGEIHNSVLIGFGEVSTFAGALFGVDYNYRVKYGKKKEEE